MLKIILLLAALLFAVDKPSAIKVAVVMTVHNAAAVDTINITLDTIIESGLCDTVAKIRGEIALFERIWGENFKTLIKKQEMADFEQRWRDTLKVLLTEYYYRLTILERKSHKE